MAGFLAQIQRDIARAQREAQRRQVSQVRAHQQALREAERARRAAERHAIADERERKRLYVEARALGVETQNLELDVRISELQSVLASTLEVDDYIDIAKLTKKASHPEFDPDGQLRTPLPQPQWGRFAPSEPGGLGKVFGKKRYADALEASRRSYEAAIVAHASAEQERIGRLDRSWRKYQSDCARRDEEARAHNAQVEEFRVDLESRKPRAIVHYFDLVLSNSVYPDEFPQRYRVAYTPESSQLVVEYELPVLDVVPSVRQYRYVKARDDTTTAPRPAREIRDIYASLISQITLRTLHEIFEADRAGLVETLVFNGIVRTTDPATGKSVSPCLVTLRTTVDVFGQLDLSKVEPTSCLMHLNASVSKRPDELAPVRPVLEFNMVDSRFIEETDVLSDLDRRPNLMELTPSEFESLIQNLFTKMGLETRQTRPSRDGGVDCVAFDNRPIFGGKVVIQAKRYKNTVDVSSVRDLFGTMQNEGASKGILVTTSGYGKASFEFASGKPLELIDGSHLLYLLAEKGIEARIATPNK